VDMAWIQEARAEPRGYSHEEYNKLIGTAILIETYLLCEYSVTSLPARIMILAPSNFVCLIKVI
jgi:hypothetical protein